MGTTYIEPKYLSDLLLVEVAQGWTKDTVLIAEHDHALQIGTVLYQSGDVWQIIDSNAVAPFKILATHLPANTSKKCPVIARGATLNALELDFGEVSDAMKKQVLDVLNLQWIVVHNIKDLIDGDGTATAEPPPNWLFTNATYANNVVTWDGVGTVELDGFGTISGYQVDIPSGLELLDITVPTIPDAPCIFKVEAIGDGSATSTFEIFRIESDTGSKQVDFLNNNVDATATAFINIIDDNGVRYIILKDSEGVEIHNQLLPISEATLMPIRITSIFANPNDAYQTQIF